MNLWQRFLAWLRGDYDAIVKEFDNLIARLEGHANYSSDVGVQHTQAAQASQVAANNAFNEADKAQATATKLRALIGK